MANINILTNRSGVDPTSSGCHVKPIGMEISPQSARSGVVICAQNIPIIFSVQGSGLGTDRLTAFYYLDTAHPFKSDDSENWIRGDSSGGAFKVQFGFDGQIMRVTPQVDQGVYLYLVQWNDNHISVTDNVIEVGDNEIHNQVLVFTQSGWASDPSGSNSDAQIYPIEVIPDLQGVRDTEPDDPPANLTFNLQQTQPEAPCPSSGHIPAKSLIGFRFMNTGNPGIWYRPTGSAPGHGQTDPAFNWVSPSPPPNGELGTQMTITDVAASHADTSLYVYVVEWVDVCGKYWVCDPKIKNQPTGPWPPEESPCGGESGAGH